MLRTVKLLVVDTDEEITIPVTPESFQVSKGIRVETINIHQVGDANLLGYGTLDTITLPLTLPSTADSGYPFAHTVDTDAYGYIEKFTTLQENKKRVRFIVSDTPVNVLCVIESVEYGERDGTNDVYGTLTLREYRELKATIRYNRIAYMLLSIDGVTDYTQLKVNDGADNIQLDVYTIPTVGNTRVVSGA